MKRIRDFAILGVVLALMMCGFAADVYAFTKRIDSHLLRQTIMRFVQAWTHNTMMMKINGLRMSIFW